jgi:hypothetical protein
MLFPDSQQVKQPIMLSKRKWYVSMLHVCPRNPPAFPSLLFLLTMLASHAKRVLEIKELFDKHLYSKETPPSCSISSQHLLSLSLTRSLAYHALHETQSTQTHTQTHSTARASGSDGNFLDRIVLGIALVPVVGAQGREGRY